MNFADDTALVALGDGRYEATLTGRWWIVTGPNGGLLAALLLRAAEHVVCGPRPELAARIITVQFMSGPREGTVQLSAAVERQGRRIAFARVTMTQDATVLCQAKVTFGATLGDEFDLTDQVMPAVPSPEDSPWFDPARTHGEARRRWDRRHVEVGEAGTVAGWLRLEEPGVAVDGAVLALMCDNLPPSLRTHEPDPALADRLHTTTIEMTVYLRVAAPAVPDGEPCLVVLRSGTVREGFHQEDGEVWSRDGRLLATSRQLALVFRRD